MSTKNLEVKVTSRTVKGSEVYEGTVSIPGLKSTKLSNVEGVSTFANRSSLSNVANRVAKSLGYNKVIQYTSKAAKTNLT